MPTYLPGDDRTNNEFPFEKMAERLSLKGSTAIDLHRGLLW